MRKKEFFSEFLKPGTNIAARAGKLKGRDKGLAPGQRGDVVEFRYNPQGSAIEILRTYVSGALVYERQGVPTAAETD